MRMGFVSIALGLVCLVLISLAVVNRAPVPVVVDPFGGTTAFELPLYLVVYAALMVGVVAGGVAAFFSQRRVRRLARHRAREVERLKDELEITRAAGGHGQPQRALPSHTGS